MLFVVMAAVLASCRASAASVYFIAPDGADDADGTRERPFATVERAQRAIRQLKTSGNYPAGGVTVFIRGGRYPMAPGLSFDEYDSGEPGSPVTWRAYRGESPVFDGGWRVPELKPVEDAAALASIPPVARGHVRCCDVKAAGYEPDVAVASRGRRQAAARPRPVDLYGDGVRLTPARDAGGDFGCPIEKPGEWRIDSASGVLYVWPPEGCRELVLSDFPETFLEAVKLHDVRFGGLTFEYGRWDAARLTMCRNIQFAKNTIRNFGRHGITAGAAHNVRITGGRLACLGGMGVSVSGGDRGTLAKSESVVSDNEISFAGQRARAFAPGLCLGGCGFEVMRNHIHDMPSSAVHVEGCDCRIVSNVVERVAASSDGRGGIDICGASPCSGVLVSENTFRDVGVPAGADGARAADVPGGDIPGVTVSSNVRERCARACVSRSPLDCGFRLRGVGGR